METAVSLKTPQGRQHPPPTRQPGDHCITLPREAPGLSHPVLLRLSSEARSLG